MSLKCSNCLAGNIRPRYRRGTEPRYYCQNCGHRHRPSTILSIYAPVWKSTAKRVKTAIETAIETAAVEDPVPAEAGTINWPVDIVPVKQTPTRLQKAKAWLNRRGLIGKRSNLDRSVGKDFKGRSNKRGDR